MTTITTDKDDLEPIEPGTAQEVFLDHKATDCTDSTVRNHRSRLNPFVRWCGENGIDNLNDLSGRDLQRYRLWRKEDGDLKRLHTLTPGGHRVLDPNPYVTQHAV